MPPSSKAPRFSVEVEGGDTIARVLKDPKLWVPSVNRRIIDDAAKAGEKTARRAAKPHAVDKGTLGRAVRLKFLSPLEAIIDLAPSVRGVARVVEEGRRPGRRPPYGAIKRWGEAHGVIPAGRGASKYVQELRDRIRDEGTRGVHFMEQASEVADKLVRSGVPRASSDIEATWERQT